MTPQKQRRDSSQAPAQRPGTGPIAASAAPTSPIFVWGGTLACAGAFVLCLLLLLAANASVALPGCGDASPCDQASKSVWGRVPGVNVSVAGVGLCYFAACGLAWLRTRGQVGVVARTVVTLGALVSALYIAVMIAERLLCGYCLASHVLHFVFVACVWLSRRRAATQAPRAGVGLALVVFLLSFAVVFGIETRTQSKARATSERELARSMQALTQPTDKPNEKPTDKPQPTPAAAPTIAPTTAPTIAPAPHPITPPAPTALSGRHAWGPAQAGVRIVMFTDYQCPDCKLLEAQLLRLMQTPGIRDDLTVAVRHYPISTLCNPHVTQNRHPDACYAAFASETAGLLGGSSAFWTMHTWLFENNGSFTREALAQQVRTMQLDEALFFRTLESPPIKALITEDTTLANSLGIAFTPMIFINGIELRGYTAPDALVRAVTALAATKPAKAALGSDVALTARERALDEFAKAFPRTLPERFARRVKDNSKGTLSIVVVGDYAEPGTREADAALRALLATSNAAPTPSMRYSFVHFPVNQACNPHVPFTKHDKACIAARLVEAVDMLAGPAARWRAHEWIMQQGVLETLTLDTAALAAPTFLDAGATEPLTKELLTTAMAQPFVDEQIATDAKAALDAGVTNLPAIFINGRPVRTWKVGNESLLAELLAQAAGE